MAHWPCPECGDDMLDRANLMNHHRKVGCRLVCDGCFGGAGIGWVRGRSARTAAMAWLTSNQIPRSIGVMLLMSMCVLFADVTLIANQIFGM